MDIHIKCKWLNNPLKNILLWAAVGWIVDCAQDSTQPGAQDAPDAAALTFSTSILPVHT
jgi:hypothetical protein